MIKSICQFCQLHVVYDSYNLASIKDSKRSRRNLVEPLEFYGIDLNSKMSVQTDRFLTSNFNKQELQKLSREYLRHKANIDHFDVVLSGYLDSDLQIEDCLRFQLNSDTNQQSHTVIEELNITLEEADTRVIPHLSYAVLHKYQQFVVASNDTGVVVLLLYCIYFLKMNGLKKVWIVYGTGDKKRYFPIHYLAERLGKKAMLSDTESTFSCRI